MIRLLSFLMLALFLGFDSYATDLSAYLRSLNAVESAFVQENPDGTSSHGIVYISYPKKVRWDYLSPSPLVIIVNDNVVTYHDKVLEETTHKILNRKDRIFRFLSDSDALLKDRTFYNNGRINIMDVYENITFTVSFKEKPLCLDFISIKDDDGNITLIKFTNLQNVKKFPKNLFSEF